MNKDGHIGIVKNTNQPIKKVDKVDLNPLLHKSQTNKKNPDYHSQKSLNPHQSPMMSRFQRPQLDVSRMSETPDHIVSNHLSTPLASKAEHFKADPHTDSKISGMKA